MQDFDITKSVEYNFPVLPKTNKMYFLPIKPEYHTKLIPDSILRNEDASLYDGEIGHLYSLEKVYITKVRDTTPQPGDFIVIYRIGDRWPTSYSSCCTSLCVLSSNKYLNNLEDFLNECKNKSVFSKEELEDFFAKGYRNVVKFLPYKIYSNKIILKELRLCGLLGPEEGARIFDKIPDKFYDLFITNE